MQDVFPTLYKGYQFRNDVEARWAIFFDTLGVDWEYEEVGRRVFDCSFYLPDFRLVLPGQEPVYVEIWEDDFEGIEDSQSEKRWLFTQIYNANVLVLTGMPELRKYKLITPQCSPNGHIPVILRDCPSFVCAVEEKRLHLVKFDDESGRVGADVHANKAIETFGGRLLLAIENAWEHDFEGEDSDYLSPAIAA